MTVHNAAVETETKGFIGERYDSDAGLQYLNARYYDPELGIFVQPDWLEVQIPGVGTHRFAYSTNDPINKFDPNGNLFQEGDFLGRNGPVHNFFKGSRSIDENGRITIRSSEALRLTIPGQVPWDDTRSAMANGEYSRAIIESTAMVAESLAAALGGKAIDDTLEAGKKIITLTGAQRASLIAQAELEEAASRLGIDLSKIVVRSGVAQATIKITKEINPRDLNTLLDYAKSLGASSAEVRTGLLANEKLYGRLERYSEGNSVPQRALGGGQVFKDLLNTANDFIIRYDFQ